MSDNTEPEWNDLSSTYDTRHQAWYQIADADPVLVKSGLLRETEAYKLAEEALMTELEKVCKLGLKVEASFWTVKCIKRSQLQTFPPANVKEYVTRIWYHSTKPKVVDKKVWESAEKSWNTEEEIDNVDR